MDWARDRARRARRSGGKAIENMSDMGTALVNDITDREPLPPSRRDLALGSQKRRVSRVSRQTKAENMCDWELDAKIERTWNKSAKHNGSLYGRAVPAAAAHATLPHSSVLNKKGMVDDYGSVCNKSASLQIYNSERERRRARFGNPTGARTLPDLQSLGRTAGEGFRNGAVDQGRREARSAFLSDVVGLGDVEDATKHVAADKLHHFASHFGGNSQFRVTEGPHYLDSARFDRYGPVVETGEYENPSKLPSLDDSLTNC